MKRSSMVVIIILFFLLPSYSFSEKIKVIGKIKNFTGIVKIFRNNNEIKPVPGIELFNRDSLKTGPDGTMGILLMDDTIFSLGNDSELHLDVFHFDPPNKIFSLTTRLIKGTFIFISGIMGKLSPDSIELLTPDGSIAIRGTKLAIQIKEKQ